MQRLWLKITASYLILSIVFVLILWFFISSIIKNTYTDMTEVHLLENAQIISEVIELGGLDKNPEKLSHWMSEINDDIDIRYTVINEDGEVLTDSEADVSTMDNHLNRPEVTGVLVKKEEMGSSTRLSDTKEDAVMCVAIPVISDGVLIGVVRTSISTPSTDRAIGPIWNTLGAILVIILLVSSI